MDIRSRDGRSGRSETRSGRSETTKRPGDWYCYECGELNYASREVCYRGCRVRRPAALSRTGGSRRGWISSSPRIDGRERERERERDRRFDPYTPPPSFGFSTSFNSVRGDRRPGDWDCPNCYGQNYAWRSECFKCQTGKPGGIRKRPGDWWCGRCKGHNYAYRDDCFKCQADKVDGTSEPPAGVMIRSDRREGDWDCPLCKAHNYASRTECFKCREPKPDD